MLMILMMLISLMLMMILIADAFIADAETIDADADADEKLSTSRLCSGFDGSSFSGGPDAFQLSLIQLKTYIYHHHQHNTNKFQGTKIDRKSRGRVDYIHPHHHPHQNHDHHPHRGDDHPLTNSSKGPR